MPVIRGNDVFTINGARIAKQGAAHLKPGMDPAVAAEKTKKNGLDEMIVAFEGPDGKPERVIVYGDNLDFSFRKSRTEPDVRLNGQPGMLIHYEDEPNGFLERVQRGLSDGFTLAMDSVGRLAKRSVEGASYAGAASFLGGTIWVVATKGAALSIMKDAAIVLGPKVAVAIGVTTLVGVGLFVVVGLVKSIASGGNETKMETIAGVVDDNPAKGIAAKPPAAAAPVAPAPSPVTAPAPVTTPAANRQPGLNARPIRLGSGN